MEAMKLEVNRAFKRRIAREKKRQEKIDLAPARNLQPKSRTIRYDNMKSARAEESVVVLALREPALLDQAKDLKPEMFSVPLLGKAYTQMCDRHAMGLEVALSGLAGFEPEEMSHIAGLLRQQEGPVNERAFTDCVQIIKREHQSSKVETEEDIMALRDRLKERKGIRG